LLDQNVWNGFIQGGSRNESEVNLLKNLSGGFASSAFYDVFDPDKNPRTLPGLDKNPPEPFRANLIEKIKQGLKCCKDKP
jgi:hypothetical protein